MGYTHYWYRPEELDGNIYPSFVADALQLAEEWDRNQGNGHLAGPAGEEGTDPEFSRTTVSFNGLEDDSHESFIIPQMFPKDGYRSTDEAGRLFDFCKTARKPYDALVCAVLIAFKHHFGDTVVISSDGDWVPKEYPIQTWTGKEWKETGMYEREDGWERGSLLYHQVFPDRTLTNILIEED
jgi:hypothetical protein